MEEGKRCPSCGRSYSLELRFCLEDGTPLVEVRGELGSARRIYASNIGVRGAVVVKGRKGEVEAASAEGLEAVRRTLEGYALLLDQAQERLQGLEGLLGPLSRALEGLRDGLREQAERNSKMHERLIEGLGLLNTTLNDQANDLLASTTSISRMIREVASNIGERLGALERRMEALEAKVEEALGSGLKGRRERGRRGAERDDAHSEGEEGYD